MNQKMAKTWQVGLIVNRVEESALAYLLAEAVRHAAQYEEHCSLLRMQTVQIPHTCAQDLLRSALRQTDVLLTMDECAFAIVLPATDFLEATVVAEQLLQLLPMSIGVASTSEGLGGLQERCEAALSKAIRRGGSRVCFLNTEKPARGGPSV